MGYGKQKLQDLAATIAATPCDLVLVATPIDLRRVVKIDKPAMRVRYELQELAGPTIEQLMTDFVARLKCARA
jgi:predicted GTPase